MSSSPCPRKLSREKFSLVNSSSSIMGVVVSPSKLCPNRSRWEHYKGPERGDRTLDATGIGRSAMNNSKEVTMNLMRMVPSRELDEMTARFARLIGRLPADRDNGD